MNGEMIKQVDSHKHLGIFFSNTCTWNTHLEYVLDKAWSRINIMRRLKYTLDRKSLEILYISFIRPLLEYGDVVFCNISRYEVEQLESVQIEAARLVTGATKLVSLEKLYVEVGWDTLECRRNKHCLTYLFRMHTGLSPNYLSSLIPQPPAYTYNLRNTSAIPLPKTRTKLYYDSFLPTSIRLWNNLPSSTKTSSSLGIFKNKINAPCTHINRFYYYGDRRLQVLHVRLRTGCSALNYDLNRKNIVTSSSCSCGAVENVHHYFLECPLFAHIRRELLSSISAVCQPSLDTILFGETNLNYTENCRIIDAVHKYIRLSNRFK